ncbi:M23 family metallopeptidase [Arthrobacter jiangjiafuii]|uniref:M23 family metallopeptidase n=1 Tax=Arthrobacter jiangjiafuii TaxID=2817475 RepID=UPI002355CB69|nr:M23 family metallopeptidase [Arthrobacter jiangjiafuii]
MRYISELKARVLNWATDNRPPGLEMKSAVGKHLPEKVPTKVSAFAKQLPEKLPPAVTELAKQLPEKLPPAVRAGSLKRDWLSTPLRKTAVLSAGTAVALGGVVVGTAHATEPFEIERTSVVSQLDELLYGKTDPGAGNATGSAASGGEAGAGEAGAGEGQTGGDPGTGAAGAEASTEGGDAAADAEGGKHESAAAPETGEAQAPAEEAAPAEEPAPEPVAEEPAPSVPLDDIWVTNEFGWRSNVNPLMPAGAAELHNGIDFGANTGTPVKSFAEGTVTYAEYHQYGGLRVVIDHGNGLETTYNHMNEILVDVGQHVDFNQQIGTVGTTGNSTGPHLHFEMLRDGEYIDPAPLLGL